jgi:hypothetical protein
VPWLENLPLSFHLFFSQFKLRFFKSFFWGASRSLGMTLHRSFKRTSYNSFMRNLVLFTFNSQRFVFSWWISTSSEKLNQLTPKRLNLIFQRRIILSFAFTFPFIITVLRWQHRVFRLRIRSWIILISLLFTCKLRI